VKKGRLKRFSDDLLLSKICRSNTCIR